MVFRLWANPPCHMGESNSCSCSGHFEPEPERSTVSVREYAIKSGGARVCEQKREWEHERGRGRAIVEAREQQRVQESKTKKTRAQTQSCVHMCALVHMCAHAQAQSCVHMGALVPMCVHFRFIFIHQQKTPHRWSRRYDEAQQNEWHPIGIDNAFWKYQFGLVLRLIS